LTPFVEQATAFHVAPGPCEVQVFPELIETKIGLKFAAATNLLPSAEQAMLVQGREGSVPLATVVSGAHVAPEFVEA
jgi:hypothetical protein